jgi:ubiquinone/menaquinone biosynthesis C-methylase UbiE
VVGKLRPLSRAWFEKVENYRYEMEPFIHSTAQFTRHRGQKILEIGVGAGTDHLQWARAGAKCYGVDLTDAAILVTREHLRIHGFRSDLRRTDAEELPFEKATFDVVYSWGVIHHSEKPELIIAEIKRVLKPGGVFIGMLYGRHSLVALKCWVKNALLKGKPWKSFSDVLWHHFESVGTKAYTRPEIRELFSGFSRVEIETLLTGHDKSKFPKWASRFFPDDWGWFISVKGRKA